MDDDTADWVRKIPTRTHALVFEGPPGIGKTFAFSEVVERATTHGLRILRAQPAQAELLLVGSALIDLCSEVDDAEIAALPDAQATALSAALLRSAALEIAHPQAVALGFSTLLHSLAAATPTLICIDDLQWLDTQTVEVLTFAARRLPAAGVGLLATVRIDPGAAPPPWLADLAAALPLTRHVVAPMNETALTAMLRARLGARLTSSAVRAAIRGAGGNPLFALEIARALLARDEPDLPDSVPMPDSLFEVVGRHVTQLPEATRAALAAAAAMRKPTLRQLADLGHDDDLAPAERAGIVRIREHEIVFNHPMYAAASYQQLSGTERIRLHGRLAEVVDGDEERARHLAQGAAEPDEHVAAALDTAYDRAMARGAFDAALDASRLAVRATPAGSPALSDRRVKYARLLFRAGDGDPARAELTLAIEQATGPLPRARAMYALAQIINDTEAVFASVPVFLEALELAGPDPQLAADIHMGLAICYSDDWRAALEHARTARALVESVPSADPARIAKALLAEVGARFYLGDGADIETCRRAIELQDGDLSQPVADRAISVLFYLQFWTDDFAGARATMNEAYKLALDEGDEASRGYVLVTSAKLEVRSGLWEEATRLIDECLAIAEAGDNASYRIMMAGERAWLSAYRGDLAPALELAAADVERGVAAGDLMLEQRGRGLRGWCELTGGDARAAAEDLDRYMALFEFNNAAEPGLRQLAADHIEALVGAGRFDDAERALATLVEPATRLDRTTTLAGAARAEALLRAEQGDVDAAIEAATRSLALYDRVERRLDRARTLLAKGQIHRRFKQRALARQDLSDAVEAFERLGALGFAGRARIELARIGSRAPASRELSATESQIADLAARGMRSEEIGRTLFLSTKTISANLTRVYQKLGVRNRAELAALLTSHAGGDVSASRP